MSWDDAIDGVDRETPGHRMPRALQVAARLEVAANDDDSEFPAYAELHCMSDFTFLRGASNAEALFTRAAHCGYEALAITDECSLAGIVRALEASRATGVRLVVGSEFRLDDGLRLVLLVESLAGYTALCELITRARRRAAKGTYRIARDDLEGGLHGTFAIWLPGLAPDRAQGQWLRQVFGDRAFLAVQLHRDDDDTQRLATLAALADALGMAAVACGDVHMATRRDRVLQDTMTAIRHGLPLADCGAHLFRNGERHLRTRRALSNIHPHHLLANAVALSRRCTFSLDEVRYDYPAELVPAGETPTTHLRALTLAGMQTRWPEGTPHKVAAQIEDELQLVARMRYEPFFLTVHDIVAFARSRGILCQGRGSAANSAVCFSLGITAVNPAESRLLMARFISENRNEPPDIDVDFEHERREEVLQYIYAKYGRARAALAATVIRYRGKSAVRDVAKAFALPADQIALLSACYGWGNGGTPMAQRIEEAGFDPRNPLIDRILQVTALLEGHPRHLSQHVGGFVICDAPLSTVVPVENAAMPDRTIIQWDKDDLETMKMLKVDCLALGMLTCIRKAIALVERHRGYRIDPARLPADDPATYAMIQAADTVGVFQIESRAQMTMLPRLKPAKFYDLVVEVAIVRPGPIQGGMVHPYLRRRMNREAVTYPSEEVRAILEPTLGVPLFQEQVMELVMHAAQYSPDEADQLRRSMAAWRSGGDMEVHRQRIRERMGQRNYSSEFIDQIFEQIKGFGSYGFPQSHAASFAKLVYVSCWLKRHEPAAFACALLNAQPMGFYSSSQIVQDARRGHAARDGVDVFPVDVMHSEWDNTLTASKRLAVGDLDTDARRHDMEAASLHRGAPLGMRLGLREVRGLSQPMGEAVVQARARRPFRDIEDACLRAGLDRKARQCLAEAGAFDTLAGHRNAARWTIAGIERRTPLIAGSPSESQVQLPMPALGDTILADYSATGLTLSAHPMSLLRSRMAGQRMLDSKALRERRHGSSVRTAGLVTQRQRPATAKGTIFVTLEDEHGMVNVIVWPDLALRQRKALLASTLLAVRGRWEHVDGVHHLIAHQLDDMSSLLGGLRGDSRDFH